MKPDLFQWWRDVSTNLSQVTNEASLKSRIESFTAQLGFDFYSLLAKGVIAKNENTARFMSNYPELWLDRYQRAGYLSIDPTVRMGARSRSAVVWSQALFSKTPDFWHEAQSFGLRAGLAQSGWGRGGMFTLLSMARERRAVSEAEATALQPFLLMLIDCATEKLQQLMDAESSRLYAQYLTPRETEVLKWMALGKTAHEISEQLGVANVTIHYHLQNAKRKLGVATKIQATDRAKRLGIID